jgi:hypothetical protein
MGGFIFLLIIAAVIIKYLMSPGREAHASLIADEFGVAMNYKIKQYGTYTKYGGASATMLDPYCSLYRALDEIPENFRSLIPSQLYPEIREKEYKVLIGCAFQDDTFTFLTYNHQGQLLKTGFEITGRYIPPHSSDTSFPAHVRFAVPRVK